MILIASKLVLALFVRIIPRDKTAASGTEFTIYTLDRLTNLSPSRSYLSSASIVQKCCRISDTPFRNRLVWVALTYYCAVCCMTWLKVNRNACMTQICPLLYPPYVSATLSEQIIFHDSVQTCFVRCRWLFWTGVLPLSSIQWLVLLTKRSCGGCSRKWGSDWAPGLTHCISHYFC